MMNMIRAPEAGRSWEGAGADVSKPSKLLPISTNAFPQNLLSSSLTDYFVSQPYLTGIVSAETIKGIQSQGVIACAKVSLLPDQHRSYT